MNTHVRPPPTPELIARFSAIVGERHAVTDSVAQEPYLVEGRGLYHGRTPLVLRPGSVEEVAAILKLADATATAIVPQGGNTGLVGGQIALDGEVVLALTRLDRIREVDAASGTMTCEAGVVLVNAQQAAAAADRLFPLSLGAEGSCTIGGNLSTNAGGTDALAYGVARDLVVGIEVVLADGRVLHLLNKLKKDNTGYDLKNLFIGAEGTLGIITAAVLKLFPAPKTVETAFVGVPSPDAALALLHLVQERTNRAATSFELICRAALEFALRHGPGCRDPLASPHPWYVLVQVSSAARQDLRLVLEETLEAAMEQGLAADAAIADSLEHRRAFWHLREMLPEVQKPERRLDQARHLGPGRRGAGVPARSRRRRAGADPGLPAGTVRPSRRRQHPLQRQPAGRRRHQGLSRALVRDECRRACGGREIRRLDFRRARHRRDETQAAAAGEGPGRARPDAGAQTHARSQRHPQSGQGAVTAQAPARHWRDPKRELARAPRISVDTNSAVITRLDRTIQ
jgi:FAD/FMN-containing dehydrogenase